MIDPTATPTDADHEAAFIAAIQPDATNADIDHFVAVHQAILYENDAYEQSIIDENQR